MIEVIGHASPAEPLQDYCLRLMMRVARNSVEPLAAVTVPERVSAKHQSLLNFEGQPRDRSNVGGRSWIVPLSRCGWPSMENGMGWT